MNWLIKLASKWLIGRRSKLAGIGCFCMAALGIVVNIRPDLLPMVDVMSWDQTGGWIVAGMAAFGLSGKADKLIEATKENTEAVKEIPNANVQGTEGQAQQRCITPELTDEQRAAINSN